MDGSVLPVDFTQKQETGSQPLSLGTDDFHTSGQSILGYLLPIERHGPHQVLLCGDSKTGKTSLLFDYAHGCAKLGQRVTFICMRARLESCLPKPFVCHDDHRMKHNDTQQEHDTGGWQPGALSLIGLKYVQTSEELNWYLASIHQLQQSAPDVLIVDDLDRILESTTATPGPAGSGSRAMAALHTLALLEDVAMGLPTWRQNLARQGPPPPPPPRPEGAALPRASVLASCSSMDRASLALLSRTLTQAATAEATAPGQFRLVADSAERQPPATGSAEVISYSDGAEAFVWTRQNEFCG